MTASLLLIFAAAIMNASYTLPMKLHRKWRWEHSWLAFSVLGVAVVPTIIAMIAIPGLWSIYRDVSPGTLAAMALFGFGWGVSMVFFGLAIPLVGVAIVFTISLSTGAASGSLLPLLMQHPDRIVTAQGGMLLLGIALIALGVAVCGKAGLERDRARAQQTGAEIGGAQTGQRNFFRGFVFALISGVLGSLLNLGLAFGDGIQQAARMRGASVAMSSNAVWLPCVYAGFAPGVLYCVWLMRKNATTALLRTGAVWHYWLTAASMGLLWYGSVLLYSLAANKLGAWGPAIGWPLFLSSIVLMSTVVGILTREWVPSSRGPFRTLLLGLILLLAAIGVLSEAGRMSAP